MINKKHILKLSGMEAKQKVLNAVYDVYEEWVAQVPLACRKGCSACCTQSVTMTGLEGLMILEFAERRGGRQWLKQKLAGAIPGKSKGLITTNQFAAACLSQRDVGEEAFGCWDFTPCVFLEKGACTIYEVRPFGCRSFASSVQCTPDRAAEIAPIHLAVNIVFSQIIEHINSDGGYWSTMTDMLHALLNIDALEGKPYLLPAMPVPGFLLDKHEIGTLRILLQRIDKYSPDRGMFGDLIDNFIPI